MIRRPPLRIVAALLGVGLFIAGCDSGPSGPGAVEVIVSGEALAGVLVQLDGPGIREAAGLGDTRVYAAPDPEIATRHRVVAITPGSGEVRFSVEVDDLEIAGPQVTVLQATRADNRLVTPSAATVRIVR